MKYKGPLYASLAALGFGLTIPTSKIAADNFALAPHQFYTALVALIFLLPIYFLQKDKKWYLKNLWKEYFFICFVAGLIPAILAYLGFLYGFAANAAVLFRFEVFVVIIFGVFFLKEKINSRQLFGVTLGFVGTIIFVTQFQLNFSPGDLFVLLAAILYSCFTIVAKKMQNLVSAAQINISRMLITVAFFGIYIAYTGTGLSVNNPESFFALSFSAFGVFVLGAMAYVSAVKYWTVWKVVFVAQFGSVIIGYIGSVLILNEAFGIWQWFGTLLIIVSMSIVLWRHDESIWKKVKKLFV